MSTRSTIAIELEDGTVKQIYCHSDGYLSYVGKVLLNHYDSTKTNLLMSQGDCSMLGKEIGEKINFDDRLTYSNGIASQCRFYKRDRGEMNVGAKQFESYESYRENHQYEEFEYILRNTGEWFVLVCDTDDYVPLADAIATEMLDNEMAADE